MFAISGPTVVVAIDSNYRVSTNAELAVPGADRRPGDLQIFDNRSVLVQRQSPEMRG
jgi:hypothetical protein